MEDVHKNTKLIYLRNNDYIVISDIMLETLTHQSVWHLYTIDDRRLLVNNKLIIGIKMYSSVWHSIDSKIQK